MWGAVCEGPVRGAPPTPADLARRTSDLVRRSRIRWEKASVAATTTHRVGGACKGSNARPRSKPSLDLGFFLFFFIFINRGGQLIRLGKSVIYRDLTLVAGGLPASVNPFRPPRKKFYVVVLCVREGGLATPTVHLRPRTPSPLERFKAGGLVAGEPRPAPSTVQARLRLARSVCLSDILVGT